MSDASFDVDDLLAVLQPVRASARICPRWDLVAEHEALDLELSQALQADTTSTGIGDEPTAPGIAERVRALEEQIAAAEREFTFEALGKRAWLDLIAAHPPKPEHEDLDHNPETFPAAAVAASCVVPKMTLDQVHTLEERLNLAQWRRLWQACLAANVGDDSAPKSLAATAVLRRSGASSTTARLEESLAASS